MPPVPLTLGPPASASRCCSAWDLVEPPGSPPYLGLLPASPHSVPQKWLQVALLESDGAVDRGAGLLASSRIECQGGVLTAAFPAAPPHHFQALLSLAQLEEYYSSRATPQNHYSAGGGQAGQVAEGREAVVLALEPGDKLAGPAEGRKQRRSRAGSLRLTGQGENQDWPDVPAGRRGWSPFWLSLMDTPLNLVLERGPRSHPGWGCSGGGEGTRGP